MTPPETFSLHLGFLAETPSDRKLFQRLANRVVNTRMDGARVRFSLKSPTLGDVVCEAAFVGSPADDTPESLVRLARAHNGIFWESGGGGQIGFGGLGADGRVAGGNFEADFIAQGNNQRLIAALAAKGLEPSDPARGFHVRTKLDAH